MLFQFNKNEQINNLQYSKYQYNNLNKNNSFFNENRQIMPKISNQFSTSNNLQEERKGYFGEKDNKGNKIGFGIQIFEDGSTFKGIFSNDKANGWAIYEQKDGDIFKGEYEEDRTSGYGEYSNGNGAIYYGYWIDDLQFGIGYEIWKNSSKYYGEYNNGKKKELEFIFGKIKLRIKENGKKIIFMDLEFIIIKMEDNI